MRLPLPSSKLVTLALVAIVGSAAAAASLAVPALWSDGAATNPDPSSPLQSLFAFGGDDAQEDDEDRGEHDVDEDDDFEWDD